MGNGISVRTSCWLVILLFAGGSQILAQGTGPELFAVGSLNTPADEYGPVFNADGDEIYFTVRRNRRGSEYLVYSHEVGGEWSTPTALPFSGDGYDKEPYLSPDGSQLFFASNRPVPSGADLDFELWISDRTASGWGEPRHLAVVGSPAYDNYPAVAGNRNLYFGSARIEGRGRLFRAVWNGSSYEEATVLQTVEGVQIGGADPYIDPAERFMIFSSTRSGGFGEGDLYLTIREEAGWSEPLNLGAVINTDTYEFTAFVSRDESYLYFSRGWGEMWRIPVSEIAPLVEALRRRP